MRKGDRTYTGAFSADDGTKNPLADSQYLKNDKVPHGTSAGKTPDYPDYAGGKSAKNPNFGLGYVDSEKGDK